MEYESSESEVEGTMHFEMENQPSSESEKEGTVWLNLEIESKPSITEDEETAGLEDDPSLLINWNYLAVDLFVQQVNDSLRDLNPEKIFPSWIILTTGRLETNADLLMNGIAAFLRSKGSGSGEGCTFIGPNNMVQFIKVISAVCCVQNHPFMQEMMRPVRATLPVAGPLPLRLARLSFLPDKAKAVAERFGLLQLNGDNGYIFS